MSRDVRLTYAQAAYASYFAKIRVFYFQERLFNPLSARARAISQEWINQITKFRIPFCRRRKQMNFPVENLILL